MDHLIKDHENRSRMWGKRDFGIDINEIKSSSNGKTRLMEKLFIIGISAAVAFLTRVSWLDKVKNLRHRIGLLINKIGRKNVPIKVPEVVVSRRGNNFIPKLLISLVLGSGLGIGIFHNQEYLRGEIDKIGDKLRTLQLENTFLEIPEKLDQGKAFVDKFAKQTNSQLNSGLKIAKSNLNKGFKHANKGISIGIDKTVEVGKKIGTKIHEIQSTSVSTISEVSISVSSSISSSLHEVVNEGKQIITNIDTKSKQIFSKLTAKKNSTRLVKTMMFAELTKDGDSSIRATFVNANGLTLAARLWEATSKGSDQMRPFVIFLHGIGAHVNRVPRNESGAVLGDEYVANYFLRQGFNFYSFDMEGHGFSQGERIYIRDWKSYMADAEQFLDLVKRRAPKGTPYFLMGESFGGALSVALGSKLWGISDENINVFKDFKGVLLVAPALSVDMPSPVIVFILRYLLAPIMPKVSPFFMPQPLSASKIWEDKSIADWCLEEDTLGNGRDKLKLGTAMQVVLLMEYVQNLIKAGKVSFPWAVVQADNDLITPIEGANLLLNFSIPYIEVTKNKIRKNANKMLTIRAGYHDLLTSKQSDMILAFLTQWSKERLVAFYEKLNK